MKPLLKFVAKCILAALPFLLVGIFTLVAPLCYMDSEYPAWHYAKEQVNFEQDARVLILGDSRAKADVMPAYLTEDGLNLAIGGATTIENYYTLKRYLEKNKPEKIVILFAPFHYSTMDNFWQRTMYFNYLTVPETMEVFREAKGVLSDEVIRDGYVKDAFCDRTRVTSVYLPALMNAKFVGRYSANRQALSDLAAGEGHMLFGTADYCDDLNYEVHYENMRESGDSELIGIYLLKILDLCRENQIPVILAQPPMNEASYTELHEGYVRSFGYFMQSVQDLYPEITVETEIPCYGNEMFGDSSHLNRRGAERFTKELAQKYNL